MAKNPEDPIQINLIFTEATLDKHTSYREHKYTVKAEHV